ncbi:MAG: single-stranded DNA-binding protein [Thermomicrobiales bacterium]
MASVSKVILIGNLGRDPETRFTPNGTMNVQFSMATNRRWNDQAGQTQERTTWFRVTAWGKLAETLNNLAQQGYLVKGSQVYVSGNLEARDYVDRQGQNRTSLDVSASELQLLGGRGDSEGGTSQGSRSSDDQTGGGDESGGQDFDDVPF